MTFASQLADCCATVSVFSNADYVNVVISGTSSLSWFLEYLIWAHLRPHALKYVHTVVMIARCYDWVGVLHAALDDDGC